MADPLNPAYDLYEVLDSLSVGDDHVLLRLEEEVDEYGDCDRYDSAGFASKLLDYMVRRLGAVLGEHAFYDGEAHDDAPDWIRYSLLAYWNHAGQCKYIAWSVREGRNIIVIGKRATN